MLGERNLQDIYIKWFPILPEYIGNVQDPEGAGGFLA